MERNEPENILRRVVDRCADCDSCRVLMDESCLFFPELYRLFDREKGTGENISRAELRQLVERCNFCALCPCPNIREDILTAKTQYMDRTGVAWRTRLIADVAKIGRICGMAPGLANSLFRGEGSANRIKALLGIHPRRIIPEFPDEHFPAWVKKQGLHQPSGKTGKHKVAYFAGCTAGYLFPEVARATVDLLRHSGADVYCPEVSCCGMPTYLEGDRKNTLRFVGQNLDILSEAVEDGYNLVCSCPTCGYVFKYVLKEGAYYSDAYQESVEAPPDAFKIPVEAGKVSQTEERFQLLNRSLFGKILIDDGFFSDIDPLKRISVAENTSDLGDFLTYFLNENDLAPDVQGITMRAVYYPPCHLREQNIGSPYLSLLKRIPGLRLESVDWSLYCCGMAGIMGFKKDFHQPSLQLGRALLTKIESLKPDLVITDCLSCRLQFQQQLPFPVSHPVKLLKNHFCGGSPLHR